jgi:hypothetical protein
MRVAWAIGVTTGNRSISRISPANGRYFCRYLGQKRGLLLESAAGASSATSARIFLYIEPLLWGGKEKQ